MMRKIVGLVLMGGLAGCLAAEPTSVPVRVGKFAQEARTFHTSADGFPSNDVREVSLHNQQLYVRTDTGDVVWRDGKWISTTAADAVFASKTQVPSELRQLVADAGTVLSVAHGPDDQVAIGTEQGLFLSDATGTRQVFPAHRNRRWAPTSVSVDFDGKGRLWFASYQGAGCNDDGEWTLYAGEDGLPMDNMTSVACTEDGTVWFGTDMGVVRWDGANWCYRQGKRWLPNDEVRDVAVDGAGNAWIATAGGLAQIYFQTMTLAEKAAYYEREIDQYHRRTEFGYVIEAQAKVAGEKTDLQVYASDNDGLWTSMYGAGECFAYGATRDPAAKRRAVNAFRALRFLSQAPMGSAHEPPSGFIARTVLETTHADPNTGPYSIEGQRRQQREDKQWRVYEPRWPRSADGKYYWKSDTSSDELDGHYFFYALYYDLVAETEAEKARVRELVRANADHLLEHDFALFDHAGRTRWAVYGPEQLNKDPEWHVERGLNSISMLSYLNVAHHVTQDAKYRTAAKELRDQHGYHINALWPKYQRGIGSGNQSDDEMAFMAYYNLIKYEPDRELKRLYLASFANSWRQEEPEMNPFFNFCFAAVARDANITNTWGTFDLTPWPTWLSDAVDTLQRFPLDRFNWRHENHQRKDLIILSDHWADAYDNQVRGRGYRNNGKVIPVDERSFHHWNTDPWRLDSGADGRSLGTGTVFTLPYYMGLYHGFLVE